MRRHTITGQQMLDKVGGSMTAVGAIVRASHERWDGNGYPDGVAGQEVPLAARIVAAGDAFSAMTTTRAYRPAQTPEQALAELRRCAGTQFDPKVVDALVAVIERPVPDTPAQLLERATIGRLGGMLVGPAHDAIRAEPVEPRV